MRPILKKIGGAAAIGGLTMFEGALGVATAIGLTTTSDDAKNLPKLVNWLLNTPWWVPALLVPALLVAIGFWVFWPDYSTAREVEILRNQYKAVNDRAWAFEPRFDEVMDKFMSAINNVSYLTGHLSILQNTTDSIEASSRSQKSALENTLRYITITNSNILEIRQTLDSMKREMIGYASGNCVNNDSGRIWLSNPSQIYAEQILGKHASDLKIDLEIIGGPKKADVDRICSDLGDEGRSSGYTWLHNYTVLVFKYEYLYNEAKKQAVQILSNLKSINLV